MDSYAKVTRENHRGLPGVDQSSKASQYNFNSFYISKLTIFGPQFKTMKNEGFKPQRYGLEPLKLKVVGSHDMIYSGK